MILFKSLIQPLHQILGKKKNQPIQHRKPSFGTRLDVESLEQRETPTIGLVAAYNFDQAAGTILTDLSGHGNHGTIGNSIWSANAHAGSSLYFNGTNAMVTVPDSASLDLTTGMTLEAWVHPTAVTNTWRDVIYKGNNSYFLEATSTRGARPGGGGIIGGTFAASYGANYLSPYAWTHLAQTYDGATLRLYVNGVLVSSVAKSGNIQTSSRPLQLGGDSIYGQFFKGYIDDVRIYDVALSAAQIQADMNTPVSASDPTAPTVALTGPANGAIVSGTVTLSANASDYVGVVGVQFFVDGVALGSEDTSNPYAVVWDTTTAADGTYTLTARARDAAGNSTISTSIQVIVSNVIADTIAPSVSITGPSNGSSVSGTISVAANASDNVGVAGVQFYLDGVALGSEDTSSPYSFSWNTTTASDGTHTLSARARDAAGNVTMSSTVQVSVTNTVSNVINVSTISQLQSAVASLRSGQTIVIAAGTYQLTNTLYLPQNISNVTIRGATGNRDDVVIRGYGMTGSIGTGFWAGNVNGVTFADMTIRDLSVHGITLNGGTESPVIRNLRIVDINDQFIKANPDGLGGGVDNGLVENSVFEYTTQAPDTYTNGVDVHTGANWIIRNNVFRNFRSSDGLAGPAILMWNGSSNTLTEGNTFINNQRDIAYGLLSSRSNDHVGGIIRNNFISRTSVNGSDVAIGVFNSAGTQVLNNTIRLGGTYPNAIEYRFAGSTGLQIRNNLSDAAIVARDGASASVSNNVTNALSSWFVNAANHDLHLVSTATSAIDRGVNLANVTTDIDGQARPSGSSTDIGADEFISTAPPADTTAPSVSITGPTSGSSVSGTVTITANASDNVGVVGVMFFRDGISLGAEITSSPYAMTWDTTTASNGTYSLSVRARDAAGNVTISSAVQVTVNNTPADAPLLTQANLQYVGAFRLPVGTFGASTFDYGGQALAFNPANNSLFIVGHSHDQAIAEVAIPSSVINSTNVSDLTNATLLQAFTRVMPRIPSNLTGLVGSVRIGGLTVVDGKLIGTVYGDYDTTGTSIASHFRFDSLDLSTASVEGLFQVGTLGTGFVGGYMTEVPAEWQSALGAPYLTGQAALNIISRSSSGPAAFGFDPSMLGSTTAATPYVYYPLENPLADLRTTNSLFTGNTHITGAAFVPGTKTILFFGDGGTNTVGYGDAATFNDAHRPYRGWHSQNGEYAYQVWAYNVDDFIDVKNGVKAAWEITPYSTWTYTFPQPNGAANMGGVAFDPATGRLYVAQKGENFTGYAESAPLIQVYQITPYVGSPTQSAGNMIDSLSATVGSEITLTASGVHSLPGGASVTEVAFYLDSNGNGTLDRTTDTLLGYGTQNGTTWTKSVPLTALPASSTPGLPSGTYRIFAQAKDSDNLLSDAMQTLLTIR